MIIEIERDPTLYPESNIVEVAMNCSCSCSKADDDSHAMCSF